MLSQKTLRCNQLQHRQTGVSLLESLVAMAILALGVLGLLGVQLRTMVDNNNAKYSANAARLANDLFERIKTNPNASMATNASFNPLAPLTATQWDWLANYELAWGDNGTATTTCDTGFCTGDQQAVHDLNRWKIAVTSLPNGNARVLRSPDNARQMIVIVGWRANEKGTTPLSITIPGVTAPTACGSTHACYFAYGQP